MGYLEPMVQIPFLEPLINFLLKVPVIGPIVNFLLWTPIFAVWFVPGLIGLFIPLIFVIWWERKAAARVQWRYGPLEISKRLGGVIQPISDLIRYTLQEIIIHQEADAAYFIHMPIFGFIFALLPVLFIPAGPNVYAINTGYNILIAAVLISIFNVVVIVTGWASTDKWAYIGTVREAFMYAAYEIPFMLSVIAMIILFGTADPFMMVNEQVAHYIPGAILNPIAFIVAVVTTAMASSRFPFEIVENDTDIVVGPFTEYGGLIFGLTMTMSYEKTYVMTLLLSILFLGGWSGPYIAPLGDLSAPLWLGVRVFLVMMFFSFLRAIYPNYRLDQALRMGWRTLLILSVVSVIWSIVIRLALPVV